jgi:two-component system nitrogen regulation sensor histidine kinase GlnL
MKTMPDAQQQLYALIVENIGEAVIALDPQERISLFNPAAQTLTGMSEKHCLGRIFSECFGHQKILCRLVEKALSAGRSISDHETVELQRSKKSLPVSATVSPLFTQSGEQQGAVLIMRDLTQIRTLEDAIRRADRLSMVGTMAAGLAHEIKNPLGGIKGAAQLLQMELDAGSPLTEYPQVMIRETERVNNIIEELLDLSRSKPVIRNEVNIGKILNEIILLQSQAFSEKELKFKIYLDPSIPSILGDENLLTQLFLNLIKNAGEAIEEAGEIRVTTRIDSDYHLSAPGERSVPLVKIVIEDDGPGIPAEQGERIFTPFYTTKTGGTGLGLATCQKIVCDHHGLLSVKNRKEGGCAFTISLPLHRH